MTRGPSPSPPCTLTADFPASGPTSSSLLLRSSSATTPRASRRLSLIRRAIHRGVSFPVWTPPRRRTRANTQPPRARPRVTRRTTRDTKRPRIVSLSPPTPLEDPRPRPPRPRRRGRPPRVQRVRERFRLCFCFSTGAFHAAASALRVVSSSLRQAFVEDGRASVEASASLGVGEDLVGGVDAAERLRGVLRRIHVRMRRLGEAAVRELDLLRLGVVGHAEHAVRVAQERRGRRAGPVPAAAARRRASRRRGWASTRPGRRGGERGRTTGRRRHLQWRAARASCSLETSFR